MDERRVAYVCLQATRQGQASYAHVREIIGGLERRGYRVELFEPGYQDATKALPGPLGRLAEFRRLQRRVMAASPCPDLLYVRAHFAAYPVTRWAKRRGIPVVQEVNGPYEDIFTAWPAARPLRPLFERLAKAQYRAADALIAVSPNLRDWLEAETGRTDVAVIPNGANVELFRPGLPRPAGLPERYVVFFGALAPWQGVETLVAAAAEDAWPDDVALVVAGDGRERPRIEEAAARNDRVVYLGSLPYADMPALIGNSIAGLSPKNTAGGAAYYASPVKPFEILACAVPAIVTDFPGQAELVRTAEAGIVVPPEDPGTLARAVARLAAAPAEAAAMGARGREAVVAECSWDARAGATARVLEAYLPGTVSTEHAEAPRERRAGGAPD